MGKGKVICVNCGSHNIEKENINGHAHYHCLDCDEEFEDKQISYCAYCGKQVVNGKAIADDYGKVFCSLHCMDRY